MHRRVLISTIAAAAVAAPLWIAPTTWAAPSIRTAPAALPAPAADSAPTQGFPRQNLLREWPDDPSDASIPIGVIPYDEIAPKLNALQKTSDRVSARVAGTSVAGRDIYEVTVTAPESVPEARRQHSWKRLIEDDPVRAQQDKALLNGYKTPLFVNANIHGNEWEGTDAALRVIEELATGDDPQVAQLLERNRLVFNVTSNPDGRVAGTRANAAEFDLNRDLTIVSQPETEVIRKQVIQTKPIITLDLHGYVNPTLLHPSTPPHNVNNEYDLFIKHGLPNALKIEESLKKLGHAETQRARIPFRDDAPGVWDDFPPIYVPSFSMLQSTIPYTIEAPLNPRGSNLTSEERHRRSSINTDVHEAAIWTSIEYVQDHRRDVIVDQAEVYRRGWAGEPLREVPADYVPGWGPEDDYRTEFPRSYVIPVGSGQRSEAAAARLVNLLVSSDGRVGRAAKEFTVGNKTYPKGSYVVDLHQPKRGLVNSLLEPGVDITDRVNSLYAGPAAWSHGLTWGATVDTHWDDLPSVQLHPVSAAESSGSVPGGNGDLRLDLQDAADLQAVRSLLDKGVEVKRLADGSVLVPGSPENRRVARQVSREHGVDFTNAAVGAHGKAVKPITVGYIGAAEERDTLRDLGFKTVRVTPTTLHSTLPVVDVLLIGGTLNAANLSAADRASLDEFLSAGGGVVGLGTVGAAFANDTGLLRSTATAGPGLGSGVVNVNNAEGPVTAGALPQSFIFQPVWFTDLGREVTVEQTYAQDTLVAGWWGSNQAGTNGPGAAAGQASIVRTVANTGNGVVLFGTDPAFRLHPKGLQAQLGRALLWAADPQ